MLISPPPIRLPIMGKIIPQRQTTVMRIREMKLRDNEVE
ncbi:hypothetical protein ES707_05013 [subsurface metagenome]